MARYILNPSELTPDHWACTDTENMLLCVFKNKQFNETQKFTLLEEVKNPDAVKLAKLANEMAAWLRENHYQKVMP